MNILTPSMSKGEYQRLYKYIIISSKAQKKEFSQSEIKRNIMSLGVSINGSMVFNQMYRVYMYDDISIEHWPQREISVHHGIPLLYQNDEYIVIYKPRGVVAIEGAGHSYFHALQQVKEMTGNDEVVPINRIDKDTCGLMMFATRTEYQKKYQDLFRARKVHKEYLALIQGVCEKQYHITHYQCRSTHDVKKQVVFFNKDEAYVYSSECRKAVTTVKPYMVCKELAVSLVKIRIHTGRMHQIRALMEYMGYPLYNEKIYNQTRKKPDYIDGVFTGVQMVSLEELVNYINEIKKKSGGVEMVSPALDYFLCSYFLSFTDEISKPPKTVVFDLTL